MIFEQATRRRRREGVANVQSKNDEGCYCCGGRNLKLKFLINLNVKTDCEKWLRL